MLTFSAQTFDLFNLLLYVALLAFLVSSPFFSLFSLLSPFSIFNLLDLCICCSPQAILVIFASIWCDVSQLSCLTKDFSNALNPDYQFSVQRWFWFIILPNRIQKIPADSKGFFYNTKGSKKIENIPKELKRFPKFPKDSKISEKSRNSSKTQKV